MFRNTANFRRRKALRKELGIINKKKNLNLLMLNANGLSASSLTDIKSAILKKNVDIAVIIETHFRAEQSHHNNEIEGFKSYESRRSDVAEDKSGGGILVYCKTSDGLIMREHRPNIANKH